MPVNNIHNNIALLKSLKNRAKHGSIRVSDYDMGALEMAIDVLEDKVNGAK